MNTITELKQALRVLSAAELESIADWLEAQVEEARYRAFHVREAQPPMLYSSMDAQVEFRSIGLQMTLAEIYQGTLSG